MMGNSQNFFLVFKKPQKSFRKSMQPPSIWVLYVYGDKGVVPYLENG